MYAVRLLASSDSGSGSPATLLIFLLLPIGVYFLMVRPQRKRMREQASMQASIGVGDEVVTNSGIYGFITGEDGDKFWLEIDDDVQIRIARAAIQRRINPETDAATDARSTKLGDDGDGKDDTK